MPVEPIRHEFVVRCPASHAFEVYVHDIGRWWLPTYCEGPGDYQGVVIEPKLGGSVYETHTDGTSHRWGEVTDWEPGRRLRYTTNLGHRDPLRPSEIVVEFSDEASGCQVDFSHGGWDDDNKHERVKFTEWQLLLNSYIAHAEGRR